VLGKHPLGCFRNVCLCQSSQSRPSSRPEDVGVELVRTTADEFESSLAPLLDSPAVGAPLPFENLSLPDTVETEPSVADLEAASTGVTAAGYGIADYGSVVIQGGANGEEPVSLYVDEHVAVVAASDILPDMDATFDRLAEDTSAAAPGRPSSRPDRAPPRIWAGS